MDLLAGDDTALQLIQGFVGRLAGSSAPAETPAQETLAVGIAAFDSFLQANVTGPVLPADTVQTIEKRFTEAWTDNNLESLRQACLRDLDTDGISPYAHIPHLELFGLARYAITEALDDSQDIIQVPQKHSLAWMRLRINTWHYKLLTQPSLGSGSNFTKSSQWSEVPSLASRIMDGLGAVRSRVLGDIDVWAAGGDEEEAWSEHDKVVFLIEAANTYILLGRDDLAAKDLQKATDINRFSYALSGALGKKTRFQEKNISQLVVLAKSRSDDSPAQPTQRRPDTLQLNDDTLLEEIKFATDETAVPEKQLPSALENLAPDDQPQLSPLDQMILLTEATLKDAFSPADSLTSEEILPYAVRVLADKSTNWQIYTQALLVRSRIEVHRSRTVERGVLQLQAVADQVLTDTITSTASSVPSIDVTAPGDKPTSFLPAPKPSESAPAHVRLQYIHALSSPPRWHLESELAYAWAGVGSLTSALEIFKRLRLWAEVALCLASAAATEDEDGRGSGGEDKAKGIVRWRLFHKTGRDSGDVDEDLGDRDVGDLRATDFAGPERQPPPPNAPRLWCILGDLESDPSHYERAWDISHQRYARAQKSLGEHYLSQKEWEQARLAYKKATSANRLSTDMWSRLGDISLKLGDFEEAAEAYSRAIGSASGEAGGEGARTWSNLGSALWSLYCEVTADDKEAEGRDPSSLLRQSLAAYKKGASIAHDNWRIWDNVLTLAARMRPPSYPDMILSLHHILLIRKTEDAVDADVLNGLLSDVVLVSDRDDESSGIYEPRRGSVERLVCRLIDDQVIPLITNRSELWTLVSRMRVWKRDYAGAIDAAERAWRAASGEFTEADKAAWETAVIRTDELASLLENYGSDVEAIGPKWKGKIRSAVRSVMGRGRENWEDTEGWRTLEGIMEGLKG